MRGSDCNNNNNNNLIYLTLVALLVISLFSCSPNQTFASIQPDLEKIDAKGLVILEGASLIDGTGSPPRNDSVVVLKDERILTVTDKGSYTTYPKDSEIVNLTGRFLIPGLFDMHAHVAGVLDSSYNQTISENTLEALLDNGITTIRNPGGPTKESVALRDAVAAGQIKGPQIFTAGRLINGLPFPTRFVETIVNTEAEVREEVKRQADVSVDYVKLYVGLYPNLVKTAIDEAHNQGIRVIGHLYLTSWTDAANLGIDALTHGIPVSPFLLSEDKREIFIENGRGPFDHFLWLNLVDLNSTKINEMINALVKNKVPVDPTLSIYEAMLKDDPQNQHLWSKVLQLTKILYDHGVTIMSGTDIPNFGLIPGISLHHELELLVKAGINPLNVINIATSNGAEALGILDDVGTIEAGKQADMIILNTNPIRNIRNIGAIEGVIEDGQFFNHK
ncbi:MAG TPA: amidohydrolase family protein [Nitrososphaeraceae archaeon]|jgi:imidazolonepropionase-like amidohydrolase|nr:amidohydrolase family protein [Nitrososphaeraceae archaeon]